MDVAIPLYERFPAPDANGPYSPEPLFDSGSTDRAEPELVERVRPRAAELA
jgi:hypothetical protein